jgi:dipeptidyl aminopeptidase/acylaminoacyl peptidase
MSDGAFTTAFAARPLASAGIIVLQMPMNDDYDLSVQEIPDQLLGFESGIALLNTRGLIDPKRVGIIGFSRTGLHTEGALIADPQLFAAASVTDFADQSYMQAMLFEADSQPHEDAGVYSALPFGRGLDTWIKEAPGFHLDRIRTPLLITALTPVGVLSNWETYASLRMQKKPVDLMYLPQTAGYQHVLQRPLERLASQQTNVDWFRFWLQGYEDPNPTKRAQYKRWESLRNLLKAENRTEM